jgi:hypothetical protein
MKILGKNRFHHLPGRFSSMVDGPQKERAGRAVHYAFGTTMGARYGALAAVRDSRRFGWGVPMGVAIWLGAQVTTVPALRLSKPITREADCCRSRRIRLTSRLWRCGRGCQTNAAKIPSSLARYD